MTLSAADAGCSPAQGQSPRLLGVFKRWRLLAYGYTFPVFYAAFFLYLLTHGLWLLKGEGSPVYHDFNRFWVAGLHALHGENASLYAPEVVAEVEKYSGPYAIISYPPIFSLILAPLAMLPFVPAFLIWESATLIGCIAVVYRIVMRQPAIAMTLASPFTFCNFLSGQDGFLTGSLIGASLLFLERQPVLAGVFIGCLAYKPHFGILFPVALIAAKQWRAFASASATVVCLVVASAVAFGLDGWIKFPLVLLWEGTETISAGADIRWGFLLQTVYGLTRALHGNAPLAWLLQGATTVAVALIVWMIWRSSARYSLKAATLSAAVLMASPYAFVYDMAAIAIPIAFLASDQIRNGLLRGEQTTLLAVFVISLAEIPGAGRLPGGPVVLVALLCLILRRALRQSSEAGDAPGSPAGFQRKAAKI
jgi:arabinofuranan 3-O-arabinosyltransferase